MAEYKVIVTLTEVYEVFVDAESDEEAEALAIEKLSDPDSVTCLRDTVDATVDWKEEDE